MPKSRGPSQQLIFRIVLGCAFGALTAAVNHGFGPGSEYTSKVMGRDWCWLAAGLLSGVAASHWLRAGRLVISFLLPAVWSYYVWDARAGVYAGLGTPVDVLGIVTDVIAYSVFGALSGLALGLVIALIRRRGVIGLLAGAMPFAYTASTSSGVYQHTPQDPVAQQVGWVTMWVALFGMVVWTFWCVREMWTERNAAVPLRSSL